jgi:hypothetical protein
MRQNVEGRDEVGFYVSRNEILFMESRNLEEKRCLLELRHVEVVGKHTYEHLRCS